MLVNSLPAIVAFIMGECNNAIFVLPALIKAYFNTSACVGVNEPRNNTNATCTKSHETRIWIPSCEFVNRSCCLVVSALSVGIRWIQT